MPPAGTVAADVFERRVLDALPNTIYTLDLEGRVTSVNRSWSRFAEANGASYLSRINAVSDHTIFEQIGDPAAREQLDRAMALVRSGRSDSVTWEFPCNSPNEERLYLMQVAPLRDGSSITGYVCSTIDITPTHRSREALIEIGTALSRTIELDRVCEEVSRQMRRAIRYDGFAIALVDDNTGELRTRSRAGYDESDDELTHRLRTHWADAVARSAVVVDHSTRGIELTAPMLGSDGALGVMTLRSDSIDSLGRLDEVERVLSTVAAQTGVAVERAGLVHRVEEKRRLEAIGEVAAGIAHELRNPLFGISSAAQLLRFRAREDPVVERNVGRILREVERLSTMVTDLLEYGRPRALDLAKHDPDAVWDDVLDANRGLLESRSQALVRTRVSPKASLLIDSAALAQVFINLLTNAVEASPPGGLLTLESSTLHNGAWRCTLHNTGAPIPPDVLPHVFEIFFSTKPGGSGIGLALCQRIIDEHGGGIAIESSADRGTHVVVTLPASG